MFLSSFTFEQSFLNWASFGDISSLGKKLAMQLRLWASLSLILHRELNFEPGTLSRAGYLIQFYIRGWCPVPSLSRNVRHLARGYLIYLNLNCFVEHRRRVQANKKARVSFFSAKKWMRAEGVEFLLLFKRRFSYQSPISTVRMPAFVGFDGCYEM